MKTPRLALALALTLAALPVMAQQKKEYTGPRPTKADVPFLQHANKLIELEVGEATESRVKDSTVFTVAGATAKVRTPVPEPIFLFQADKINPEHFTLFKMESKGGQRTLTVSERASKKKGAMRPAFILINTLDTRLFKIEVNEILEPGEYCLSPEGANTVYCFTEY